MWPAVRGHCLLKFAKKKGSNSGGSRVVFASRNPVKTLFSENGWRGTTQALRVKRWKETMEVVEVVEVVKEGSVDGPAVTQSRLRETGL